MTVTSDSTSVTITHPTDKDTSVKILNFGATVVSWKVNGKEQLWLSEASKLDGSRAVRGGIPLVFPRFGASKGNHPATDKLPQHGFARNTSWEFLGEIDEVTAQWGLGPEQLSAETRAQWGYDFTVLATVKLASDSSLNVSLEVENTDKKPFDFNVLFHTYYRVPEVTDVTVDGFTELNYYDKVANDNKKSGTDPITVAGEVDRVYKSTSNTATINYKSKPLFTVESTPSLTDTVVWNPWVETAKNMSDFAPKDGFHQMVCVENGNVAEFTSLPPSEKWKGSIDIKAHI